MLKRHPILFLLLIIALLGSTLPATAQGTACGQPLDLTPGLRIHTRPGIYIRNLPTISGGIVEYLDSSITFRITDGPVCADGLNWWHVRGPINYDPGWIAEKESPTGRYLIFRADPDPATLCSAPIPLSIGQRVPVTSGGLRVRTEPGLEARVLTVALIDTEVTIVGGPQCVDKLNWWQITLPASPTTDVLVRGWVAEGYGGAVPWLALPPGPSLEAGNLCAPPMRGLGVGTQAYVNAAQTNVLRRIRSDPGTDAPVLYTMVDGVAFHIIAGPICANNLNWWQIQVITRPDVIGWLAEGGPGDYWIRRFRPVSNIPG